MDAQMISYGEQFVIINNWIGNLDDWLVLMEMNHKKMIPDCCVAYSIPLRGYYFAYNLNDTPRQD